MELPKAFVWHASYNLGFEDLDRQHQDFFRTTNDLLQAVRSGASEEVARKALRSMLGHGACHFKMEEVFLREKGYPQAELQAHVEEHDAYVKSIQAFEERSKAGEPILGDLTRFAAHWLLTHITRRDVEYANYIKDGKD